MRVPVALLVASLLLDAPVLRAEQASVFGGLRVQPRTPRAAGQSAPYRRLFQPDAPQTPAAAAASPATVRPPTVKCGMTIIPRDARVDPGILAPTDGRAPRPHVRSIVPTICS